MTFLSEEQEKKIDDLMEEFSRKGGMSTKELIARLNPVTIDEFFHELREKIRNYKSDK